MLLGTAPPSGTALFRMRLWRAIRAVTLSLAPAAPLRRQGAACSKSAAIPPTCGTAAEVPKNGLSKSPAPVTETPSMAVTSGLVRPSAVGPLLLKNSVLVWSGSFAQDGLTAMAWLLPEQIAPTVTTLTGVPPASDWAMMLLVTVL